MSTKQFEQKKYLSRICGSLIGGAAGDALGYEVEFMLDADIQRRYGSAGITAYKLANGIALFSDDTQMTLFTANGLLYGETCLRLRNSTADPHDFIPYAYLDWLYTQDHSRRPGKIRSWLAAVPALHDRRAPGNTCLSALRSGKIGSIKDPINNSCGCGGVMRTAPVGLFYGKGYETDTAGDIIRFGALAAAYTHGHPMGYIPAGMLSLIVNRMVFTDEPVSVVIQDSLAETAKVFGKDPYWRGFAELINKAVDCAGNVRSDREKIRELGEGWVGNEALAIAVYAVLRYDRDLSSALIAAVNHDGDSDSTGAIAGNILGARLGLEGIAPEWTESLEIRDTILEIGRDLWTHCPSDEELRDEGSAWYWKYVDICGQNEDIQ